MAGLGLLALLAASLTVAACKKDEKTCEPGDNNFAKVRMYVQAAEEINVDPEGTPRPVQLWVYQLQGGRTLDMPLDFRQVWQASAEAFGDELLGEKDYMIGPGSAEVIEVEPNPEATHLVAAAIFREPIGTSWYSEWEVPLYHGYSACSAKMKTEKPENAPPYPDPCFLISIEGNMLEGGHKAPSAIDADDIGITCPAPPLKVKPADPQPEKKKKKKKLGLKDKAEGAQEKAGEGQDAAGEAQGAGDTAKGAGDAAQNPPVPGKE